MADTLKADLCIIGAGALGTTLALTARARGLSVVLVQQPDDKEGETGASDWRRAAVMASADRAHAMATAEALGLGKADPKPGFRAIGERAAALAAVGAPMASPAHLIAQGVTLLDAAARFLDPRRLQVGDTIIRAGQFAIATGSTPLLPELPGLDEVAFFTPDTILENMRKLSHLLVIGGDATALELAQAYARLGSTVTLVPQGPLLAGFDPEPVAVLLRSLRAEGVNILAGARVTTILPRSQGIGIILDQAEGDTDRDGDPTTLDVSHILLAAGRVPRRDAAMLAAARLRRERGRPDQLLLQPDGRTSNRRITLIGGAAGVFEGAHAQQQAALVLARASGEAARPLDLQRLPRLVNTTPALAQLGGAGVLEPRRQGHLLLRANASETAAAHAAGQRTGSAKLLVADNGAILGATILGHGAGEQAAMLALALERGIGAPDLADLLLPPASTAALLVDLGRQYRALHPPSAWARRRAALRRLWP